jgi:DNA-binding NtrC family response regulator
VPKLLVVEAKGAIQQLLQQRLPSARVTLEGVRTIEEILSRFGQTTYDLVLWDIRRTTTSSCRGLELLDVLSVDSPRTQVLVVTNRDNVPLAIDCLKAGAYHYLHWPVEAEELWALIDAALQKQPALGDNRLLTIEQQPSYKFDDLIGGSAPMQEVYERIRETAATDVTILITGETGTGKDLVAAAIHRHSQRQHGPYLAVNTGAMSPDLIASELFGHEKGAFTGASGPKPGQFEQAQGGTIFLDEISTMDAKAQVSLLRLLETKSLRRLGGRKVIKVDVRLIAATNEHLEDAVARGAFRKDLQYRFDVFRVVLPPLRERYGDILMLAREFISRFNVIYNKTVEEVAPDTLHFLECYAWPGNVRELKDVIQRAVLMSRDRVLSADLLPDRVREPSATKTVAAVRSVRAGMTLREVEKVYVAETLSATGGNKLKAAKALGISRRALYNKLARYHLL